ncbi:MAG: type II toxin-antitoxin system VapC family toxin [Acidobacteriota bacterium]
MIVLDASAAVELLLRTPHAVRTRERLQSGETPHAPHLLDIEVAQALRRLSRTGGLSPERAAEALADLAQIPVRRHPHTRLLVRIWELRHNLTAYDAAYVALAEELGASLLTCDKALASSSGHSASVELV